MIDINDFHNEAECSYKNEIYSVRDNGAVLRHPQSGKRPRISDNTWTFGKSNERTGYMEIAGERVHRIVATAFHGSPPTSEHIVDHIDTNRRNNRPENLRWLTRLENAVLNLTTRKRIEYICGVDIYTFLADPIKFRDKFQNQYTDISWMRTVSKEEAQATLEHIKNWTDNEKASSVTGSMGDWIYRKKIRNSEDIENTETFSRTLGIKKDMNDLLHDERDADIPSLTKGAVQRDWKTPSAFPCCPEKASDNPILAYVEQLKEGEIFVKNKYGESAVVQFAISNDNQFIVIMTDTDGIKPFALAKITYEKGLYVHTSLGTFFSPEGAEKQFALAQGLEWTGGDSIDDYC
jgi:hypothetical protein